MAFKRRWLSDFACIVQDVTKRCDQVSAGDRAPKNKQKKEKRKYNIFIDSADYVQVVKSCYRQIKKICPPAKIWTDLLTTTCISYMGRYKVCFYVIEERLYN